MGDNYDLSPFGWDGCSIPTDLKNICNYLPSWKNMKTLRNAQVTNSYELYFPYKYFRNGKDEYMPGYIKGSIDDDGGYAQIYKGRRAIFKPSEESPKSGTVHLVKHTQFADVCIKEVPLNITPDEEAAPSEIREQTYKDEINAILYEAFLHALLYKTLEREGFPTAVPRIYEIVANTNGCADPKSPCDFESIWIVMEYIHGSTLEKFLKRQLIPLRRGHSRTVAALNEKLLIDVFIQLAMYLQILQEKVRFNHRDLKINNIFVRHHAHGDKWKQSLTNSDIGMWNCINDIVLLDFGFSCIACGSGYENPRATLVGAGSWFKSEHDCLKYGRDLGQFLYSIHSTFPLQEYVSPAFFGLLHKSMFATRIDGEKIEQIDLCMGFNDDGTPLTGTALPRSPKFNDGIYIFLRDSRVDVPGCNPSVFLRTLSKYINSHSLSDEKI